MTKIRIHAYEGYDPESKGKVEAGVKYVKYNGLAGKTFDSWQHLEQHIGQWLDDTANVRIHGTTGEPPRQRYDRDEQVHMGGYLTPAYLTQLPSPQDTRKVDKTGLLSWKSNKYSTPMAYQQAHVGVRVEGTQLVLSDLESGAEIARHGISQGKGEVIKNNDHYRDKQAKISDLEADISGYLGKDAGSALCALLKQTSPRIYKDQLVGLKALLKRYEAPPALVSRLIDRPSLTATRIREYLEAYAAHPERFIETHTGARDPGIPSGSSDSGLTRYAGIAQQCQEVDRDQLH